MNSLLSTLIALPICGVFLLLFVPASYAQFIRISALSLSLLNFVLSLVLWIQFDNSSAQFQFVENALWLPGPNMNFYLGIDGISLFFVLLTTFLVPACLLVGWSSIQNYEIGRAHV
jgi:NADH-ubiquinone oxidoreductase chain 4